MTARSGIRHGAGTFSTLMILATLVLLATTVLLATLAQAPGSAALAGPDDFKAGPALPDFGQIASVPDAYPIPAGTRFKIAFDIDAAGEPGSINRQIDTAARFLNMHVAAGVPADRIALAIVVHGQAYQDLLDRPDNASAELVSALINAGVRVELCGQTAAYRNVSKDDLIPGVEMSLSAMTSHALLQKDGYTINPF